MKNPWLKKNPLLSMWLSGVNTAASHVRSQAAAEASRQTKLNAAQGAREMMKFWTTVWPTGSSKRRKR